MSKQSEAVVSWRNRTKQRIVESMGGKCVICGYSKNTAALELHHLDKTKKLFSFGSIRANPIAWSKICEELKKCILVCANCHREIETGEVDDSIYTSSFDSKYEDYTIGVFPKTRLTIQKNCLHCNIEIQVHSKTHKFCSDVCRSLYNNEKGNKKQRPKNVIWPDKDTLKQLIETLPYTKIGKLYNVSDNSVRHWAKYYNLI